MIKPDFIQRLRDQADIVDIVGELITLKKAGANYKGCCPFHNEKSPSFNVNPNRQHYKCFGCGAAGDVFKFVMQHKNLTFSDAVHYVAGRLNEVVEYEQSDRPASRFRNLKL